MKRSEREVVVVVEIVPDDGSGVVGEAFGEFVPGVENEDGAELGVADVLREWMAGEAENARDRRGSWQVLSAAEGLVEQGARRIERDARLVRNVTAHGRARPRRIRSSRPQTRAGLAAARCRGEKLARPKITFDLGLARDLRSQGRSIRDIAAALGVTSTTLHRALVVVSQSSPDLA